METEFEESRPVDLGQLESMLPDFALSAMRSWVARQEIRVELDEEPTVQGHQVSSDLKSLPIEECIYRASVARARYMYDALMEHGNESPLAKEWVLRHVFEDLGDRARARDEIFAETVDELEHQTIDVLGIRQPNRPGFHPSSPVELVRSRHDWYGAGDESEQLPVGPSDPDTGGAQSSYSTDECPDPPELLHDQQ